MSSETFPRAVRSIAILLASLIVAADLAAQDIRLLAPNKRASTIAGDDVMEKLPHETPPFCHWDLREFANCKVPWQFKELNAPDFNTNGTVDDVTDRTIAGAIFAAGFNSWEAVDPALIGFTRTGAPGNRKGFALDTFNLVSFADTTSTGDDVQVIAVKNGKPNVAYILGSGGILHTVPGGDDQIVPGPAINTGADGIAQTFPILPDIYLFPIPLNRGLPFQVCVTPGPNATLESSSQGDDVIVGSTINTGADGVCQSRANGIGDLDNATLAITALFSNASSGVLLESDIVFNTFPVANSGKWVIMQDGDMIPDNEYDLLTVATHEIGHFIGMAHISGGGCQDRQANALMEQYWCANAEANHMLKEQDQDGCNFVYNPDLGDAPHTDNIFSTTFTSLVRGPANGRMLNGMAMRSRYAGPHHVFSRRQRLPMRNFTYEWLAKGEGDLDSECEANVTDADPFDDGVEFIPDPPRWGFPLTIKMHVKTAPDAQGNKHNYPFRPMFANAWIDIDPIDHAWSFTGQEHPISDFPLKAAGTATGTVILPKTEATVWVRARLTWPETVAACNPPMSPDLCQHEGATQFGEDEDYPISCRPVYVELPPFGDLFFVWTHDGSDMVVVPSYNDYSIQNGETQHSTVVGPVDFRTQHPESIGLFARSCLFPPPDATDWRLRIPGISGVNELFAAHLVLNGGNWQYARLAALPETIWRIPCLAPQFGGGTIYTAVNLSVYYANNPLGFSGGAWQVGQSLSTLGVTITGGQASGQQGIQWATSPFVFDASSPTGFSPSVPGTLLNSASYPPITIVQQAKNRFTDQCLCPGDLDMSGAVNSADAPGFAGCLLLAEYNPCADLNGSGRDDGEDIPLFISQALSGGGVFCPATPSGGCCTPSGGCIDSVTAEGCIDAGGEYRGDGTACAFESCPQPIGACCTPSGCAEGMTAFDCGAMGGAYMGDDSVCAMSVCPIFTGACCTDSGCVDAQTAESCELLNGEFQGMNTTCGSTSCSGILGACCLFNGICVDGVTERYCADRHGTYQGDFSICAGGCSGGRP